MRVPLCENFRLFSNKIHCEIRSMIIHVSLNTKRELVNGKREQEKWANNVSKWGWPHTNTAIELKKKIIHIAQRQWFSEINNNSTYKLHKESKREREREKGDKIWKMKETQREPFLEFRSFVDRPYYTDVCMRKIERKATIMPKNGVWLETTQRRRESKRYMKI